MLHILNGDVLASLLPPSISGKVAIVREALVEGPVAAHSIEELWLIRSKYLSQAYPELSQTYFEKVVGEFERMMTATSDTEVYCWFEKDLFCQVNLWFVLYLLKSHKGKIFLVLPDEKASLEKGFSDMNELDLEKAYRNANLLTANEKHVLSHMWELYQSHHINEAMTLSAQVGPELPFLYPAVKAWQESIPHGEYPGKPIAALKEIIAETGTDDFGKIYRTFHHRFPIYGFGDLQVKNLLNKIR